VSISIHFEGDDPFHLRHQILTFLGIDASIFAHIQLTGMPMPLSRDAVNTLTDRQPNVTASEASAVTTDGSPAPTDMQHPAAGPVTPGREPGKPGPGRQRRTKAEIEEDERYPNGFPTGGAAQANISSGAEDRVNPDDQEQGEEDTADEEAEGIEDMDPDDQGSAAEPVRTKNDLRRIVGQFGKLFQNDMLGVELAVQPAFKAAGVKNTSSCPDDKLAAVYDGMIAIGKRLEENPGEIAEISARAKAAAGALG
jgi:hypothetical protein